MASSTQQVMQRATDVGQGIMQGVRTRAADFEHAAVEPAMNEVKRRFQQARDKGISIRASFAEFFGTAGFVLLGLLTLVYADNPDPEIGLSDPVVKLFVIAFVFGIGITCMVYMTTFTSGGHLNPAVTFSMMGSGMITPIQAMAHMVMQCAGALVAVILLRILVPHHVLQGTRLGANIVPDDSHWIRAFLGEMIGMFIIQLTILETATHHKSEAGSSGPLAIGLVFTVCIIAFGPVSSSGFNPARSFAPALLSGHLGHLWIYIAGPFAGAALATPVHLASLASAGPRATRAVAPAPEYAVLGEDDATEALLPSGDAGNTV